MGLIDRFMKKLARRTPDDVKVETAVAQHHAHHSQLGTKVERRVRRKIAHESRRVNYQGK